MSASTSTSSASNDKRIILVTGANKGIGYETVKQLAQRLPHATLLLGTRSLDNGNKAIQQMRSEETTATFDNVQPIAIDVTDSATIKQAVEHVKAKHGRLDVLIQNSGISNLNGDMRSPAILDVNFDGAHDAIESFVPIIPPSTGLVILVSSTAGSWTADSLPKELQQLLTDNTASLTWPQLRALRDDWQSYMDNKPSRYQWTPRDELVGSYSISKTLVNAYACMFAAHHSTPKIAVVCPGYCATDLSFHLGTDPPAKGAESVTWPLFHADEAKHGHFYLHGVDQAFVLDAPQFFKDVMRAQAAQEAAKKAGGQ